MTSNKTMLIIMDGWGLGTEKHKDAIQHANTPYVNSLKESYPFSTLITCGNEVGLPEGQMGNSEVGHLNLGAGRIVYQDLVKINVAIKDGSFGNNQGLLNTIRYAKENKKKLHLLGLVSDGGVHSHLEHCLAITKVCAENSCTDVLVHAFTDGRDTDPKSGSGFIQQLQHGLEATTGTIATVTGRYYAMDRDSRWERVKIAYDALVNGIGTKTDNILSSIQQSYDNNITDEFLLPLINSNIRNGNIESGDAVIIFNFRTDRCREITEVLSQENKPEFGMHKLPLFITTMARYDHAYVNVEVMYEKDDLKNTLGEVLSAAGKMQVRIAETEKYPHVSFFFSGGREKEFAGEKRLMIPSPKVATYDLWPQMSAEIVTQTIILEMDENVPDFICLNFANVDMVGHTGVWSAILKAVETVDACVQKVIENALKNNYTIFLTADHGNADMAMNDDGSPNTAHTLNLVPLYLINNEKSGTLKPGKLGDIAPTILYNMGIPIPGEMTGNILTN